MKKVNTNKAIVIAFATIATVGIAGSLIATSVKARMLDGEYSPIVTNIAEAFGVTEEEVQVIFNDSRIERAKAHLQEAVNDGHITEDQMELIIVRKEEFRSDMDNLKSQDLSQEEFRDAMDLLRDEYRDWAEDNGIDTLELMRGKKGPDRKPMGGGYGGRESR